MCVSCKSEAPHVLSAPGLCEIHTEALWRQKYLCSFPPPPSHNQGRGGTWTKHWCLMGSLSQNGLSGLFLEFPLPRRPDQPIGWLGGDVICRDWCVFLEAHPSKRVLVDLGSDRPTVPWAPVFPAFSGSFVWNRKRLPAPRQTLSASMLIILFRMEQLNGLSSRDVKQNKVEMTLISWLVCYVFVQSEAAAYR